MNHNMDVKKSNVNHANTRQDKDTVKAPTKETTEVKGKSESRSERDNRKVTAFTSTALALPSTQVSNAVGTKRYVERNKDAVSKDTRPGTKERFVSYKDAITHNNVQVKEDKRLDNLILQVGSIEVSMVEIKDSIVVMNNRSIQTIST